jgi:O-phospho-L-seryl-tRNASec:L-selenocysteinyl-tRNA synthase
MTIGQVDAIVCSLDKNFLVPVSGSVVLSPSPPTIQQLGKFYAGRAGSSHIIDVFITLLSMGLHGYQQLHQQRQNTFIPKFMTQFQTIAAKYNERLLICPANTISFAMTLDHLVRPRCCVSAAKNNNDNKAFISNNEEIDIQDKLETEEEYLKSIERDLTQLGAMLFHRCVSGTRVVARDIQQTLGDNDIFHGFGSSTNYYPHAYITAACAIGLNETEMNEFFARLDKTIHEFQKKHRKKT